jgi:methylthioribose-1-phosphate isomerase
VTHIQGVLETPSGAAGMITRVRLTPQGRVAFNPAFDVTPARLVRALITERGVTPASQDGLSRLYGEAAGRASAAAGRG